MDRRNILVAGWLAVGSLAGVGIASAQEQTKELKELVTRLDLDRGVSAWLERLEVASGQVAERLFILSENGALLAKRTGGASSVVIDVDLDRLLRDDDSRVVMIHNHPSNVGLSAADIANLAKPGVLAILAVGHDGSVFVASAGRAMDADFVEARQYAQALKEVRRRLRMEWQSGVVSVAVCDAQLNHLVARTLAQAGIIKYWSYLRGDTRASYALSAVVLNRVVAGAAAYLRRVERPAPVVHR